MDIPIKWISYLTDIKKGNILNLICKEAYKVSVNLTKTPISFSTNSFNYFEFEKAFIIDNNYFLLGNNNIIVLNFNLQLVSKIINYDLKYIVSITKWKNLYVVLNSDRTMFICELNLTQNSCNILFKLAIGEGEANSICWLNDNELMIGNKDSYVYTINIEVIYYIIIYI
jgi:hypothetical protein